MNTQINHYMSLIQISKCQKKFQNRLNHCHVIVIPTNESTFLGFYIAPVLTLVVLTLLSGVLTWRQFAFGLPLEIFT